MTEVPPQIPYSFCFSLKSQIGLKTTFGLKIYIPFWHIRIYRAVDILLEPWVSLDF